MNAPGRPAGMVFENTLREAILARAHAGVSAAEIARKLKADRGYVAYVVNHWGPLTKRNDPDQSVADEDHVERCRAAGGFPLAVIGKGWLDMHGRPWVEGRAV